MGNSIMCCLSSGDPLVAAVRDGNIVEIDELLKKNPGLVKYTSFGGIVSPPLHLAAAKGHAEIVAMLLENGADVNLKNLWGQTPLMQACRYGQWEVVHHLLLFGCNVFKVEFMGGKTALHFAVAGGHMRCIRLIVADFELSVPNGATVSTKNEKENQISEYNHDHRRLSRFVNKASNGGVTALHLAALNGDYDCVHLLLDLHADVSAMTISCVSSTPSLGGGNCALHFAASSGNLKCCQVLLARGANRSEWNSAGFRPVDIAKARGYNWLVPLLSPNSKLTIPFFAPSNYTSLPLRSVLKIAREYGLQSPDVLDDNEPCVVCLEQTCTVASEGCQHELCTRCALSLCILSEVKPETAAIPGSIPCPLCRAGILSFMRLTTSTVEENNQTPDTSPCEKCKLYTNNHHATTCESDWCKALIFSEVTSETIFPTHTSSMISTSCCESQCNNQAGSKDMNKMTEKILDTTSCSTSFCWAESSTGREAQPNMEINA